MNYIIEAAKTIPLEKRINIIDELYPGLLNGEETKVVKLFKVYNQYIAPKNEQLSMQCPSCLQKLSDHFRQIVRHWQS